MTEARLVVRRGRERRSHSERKHDDHGCGRQSDAEGKQGDENAAEEQDAADDGERMVDRPQRAGNLQNASATANPEHGAVQEELLAAHADNARIGPSPSRLYLRQHGRIEREDPLQVGRLDDNVSVVEANRQPYIAARNGLPSAQATTEPDASPRCRRRSYKCHP